MKKPLLRIHSMDFIVRKKLEKNTRNLNETRCFYGASDLTRTGDLLITSEMHYRLCYTSELTQYISKTKKSQ